MIVVFTGGDEFEEGDETFEEYKEENCSEAFQVETSSYLWLLFRFQSFMNFVS